MESPRKGFGKTGNVSVGWMMSKLSLSNSPMFRLPKTLESLKLVLQISTLLILTIFIFLFNIFQILLFFLGFFLIKDMSFLKKLLVGGNWKSNNTLKQTEKLLREVVNVLKFDTKKIGRASLLSNA